MTPKTNKQLRELCKNNHYADWLNLPRLLDDIEKLEEQNKKLEEAALEKSKQQDKSLDV
jgi:hypothetical protein